MPSNHPAAVPARLAAGACCALLLLFAGAAHAQEPAGSPPAFRKLPNLAYVLNGSGHQKLDLYLPTETGAPRPLVIWIHGGGWQAGSKESCPAKPLLARGYAVASVEYRFSQEALFPAQIEDCKAAIRWLRAHAAADGLDPKRIAVWGESAGGELVALLGTTGKVHALDVGENLDQPSAVQCVVDWFGPTDFLHWGDVPDASLDRADSAVAKLIGGTVATHAELARQASPFYFVQADSAPFLIMHGDEDRLVPLQQSQEFNAALQKAGVESTLQVVPGAGHGGPGFRSAENLQIIADFLDRHLQPPHK